MKKRSVVLVLLGMILLVPAKSQILTRYTQRFETTDIGLYTTSGNVSLDTVLYSEGSRAIHLDQSATDEAHVILDTIDFSDQPNLQYATLEFMHICKVRAQSCENPPSGGMVEVKRPDQSSWTQLTGSYYDTDWGGGSRDFQLNGFFSDRAYESAWDGGNNSHPTNTWWKKERFKLSSLLQGVSQQNRKLIIRFKLPKLYNSSAEKYDGWYIDNISVKASASSMTSPSLTMITYPNLMEFPYSRDMKIVADISTSAIQGMNPDSIYITYLLGHSQTYRTPMRKIQGTASQYVGYIPFCGYDTIVSYRITAQDSTLNRNQITYPSDETAFAYYKCVRGIENEQQLYNGTTYSVSEHPFPNQGDSWMEYVYDKATLEAAGYTYGAITKIYYQVASGGGASISGLTIKMKNVDTTHTTPLDNSFYTEAMQTVFSGNHTTVRTGNNWGEFAIDTFYYAGQDILVQMCYDNTSNPVVSAVRSFPTATDKASLYLALDASLNLSGCNLASISPSGNTDTKRPNFKFKSVLNQPLKLDLGVDTIIAPSVVTAANVPTQIMVKLRNYGTNPVNGTTIYFKVDDNSVQSYNWTGTLNGLSTTFVTVTSSESFTPGFKHVVAWTADSMTVSGNRFRDHEPFNDTASTTFIACDGPMSGVRQIGGTGRNYNDIDEFIEAIRQCGVDGDLTVNIAPGVFEQNVTIPPIQGAASNATVTFQPLNGDTNSVVIRVPSTETCALNMDSARYVTFNGIRFETSTRASGNTSALVKFSKNSHHCTLTRCTLVDSTTDYLANLVNTNAMSDLTIDRCHFRRGTVAVQMAGLDTNNLSYNNKVLNSCFDTPKQTAVNLENQSAPIVDSNYFNNSANNTSAILNVNYCHDTTRITRNRIYTTNGAYGLLVSNTKGMNDSTFAIVANNMIEASSQAMTGLYNTPLEVQNAENLKVVYNAVKLDIPNRTNISAAVIGGSNFFKNIHILNNIFDVATGNGNYTFTFNPYQNTTFVINHNDYHNAVSYMLNQFNGLGTPSWAEWIGYVPQDSNSLTHNPVFLTSIPGDLRTYNNLLHGKGVSIPEVTTDIDGTSRPNPPCMGAFEFPPLAYNFEVGELLAPETSCTLSQNEHLKVVVGNTGVDTIRAGMGSIRFQMAGGAASSPETINRKIGPNDTIHFTFANTCDLSPESNGADSVFRFRVWTSLPEEVDFSNDTLDASLLALYQLPKLPAQNHNFNYASIQTLNVNSTDSVYWYQSADLDTEPFHKGASFTTERLYRDTTFYVGHFHEEPQIKITEVQFYKSKDGVTSPYPSWMNANTNFAVEVSNLGNYPVNIGGDTLMTVCNVATYNKTFVFPYIKLQPYSSVVLQYCAGTYADSATCYFGSAVSPQFNTKLGIIYKHRGEGITDAVAVNDIVSQNAWRNLNVPASICTGYVPFNAMSAGIRRTNPTDNAASSAWTICSGANRMTLGNVEESIIMVPDNGCQGYRSPISIRVQNVPPINVGITSVSVPDQGCSLYDEPVTINLTNLGVSTASGIVACFKVGNRVYQPERIGNSISSYQTISYTFSQLADLSNHTADTNYEITAWIEKLSSDSDQSNDTNSTSVASLYTPDLPTLNTYSRTINYASSTTFNDVNMRDTIVWYDKYGQALDTGYHFTTPVLYQTDTFYASGMSTDITGRHLGNLEASSLTSYPSPYHCGIKYRKEQYIVTAAELQALGYNDEPLASLSFHLDTVRTLTGSTTFTEYTISIGTTSETSFSAANTWQTVSPVYTRNNLVISNARKGWIEHIFDTPYRWDGVSNLAIQVCYTIQSPASSASVDYTTTENNTVMYSHSSTTDQSTTTSVSGRSNHRPDMRFGYVTYNCEGKQRPVYVEVIGAPNTDASLLGVSSLMPSGNLSGIPQHLDFILKNYGTQDIDSVKIQWDVDGDSTRTFMWHGTLHTLDTTHVRVGDHTFGPGEHCINASVVCVGDGYPANDTMQDCVRFCFDKTPRTIGAGGYFANFTQAVNALKSCGICDTVTLVALPGTFNEQINISNIPGLNSNTPIHFKSSTENPGDVVIRHFPNAANNYVVKFDNVSDITFDGITIASDSSNYADALVIRNSHDLTFTNDSIAVAGHINSALASAISLDGNIRNLNFIGNATYGGYYALSNVLGSGTMTGLNILENRFRNFYNGGISLQNVDNLNITHNHVHTSRDMSTSQTGIFVNNYNGDFDIQRNQVVLAGTGDGLKQGIKILSARGTSEFPIRFYNNMISIYGGGASNSNTSTGLYVDNSRYINVYYNTIQVKAGSNATATRTMEVSSCTNIKTMNNIFANFGKGYTYYVDSLQCIASSNYNDYYTTGTKLAYWTGNRNNLAALQTFNSMDGYSFCQIPYFISDNDLHLAYSTLVETGQYTNEITTDIDGNIRPQNPKPCVGAHEIPHLNHDVSVDNILFPILTSTPVETDRMMVIARFYNNGTDTARNITWHAEIDGYPSLRSTDETITEIFRSQYVSDTTYIDMPLGMIDTQYVKVCLSMAGDEDSTNNCRLGAFNIYPAFDLQAASTTVTTSACRMQSTPIKINLKNVGRKPIPTNLRMEIGYEVTLLTQGITLRNIPIVFRDTLNLTQQLAVNGTRQLTFTQNADLYPWDTLMDVQLSVRSWVKLQNDLKPMNDTTAPVTVTSKHTPASPVAVDQRIPYATWVTLNASQSQNLPIRWSKDSASTPFHAPASYLSSTTYSHPNLLYRDTTFYLSSVSSTGCTSYYEPIHVFVDNPLPYDAAISDITEPIAKVYMAEDTVKVKIKNYGTQTLTSTPVKYLIRETTNGTTVQNVSEICSAPINPQGEILYKFNTLPQFPNLQSWTYEILAWTDLPNEMTRVNDTFKIQVTPIPEATYCNPVVKDTAGLDISRVTLGQMDNPMPPLGRKYVNLTNFDNPMMDPIVLHRGMRDTLFITAENFDNANDTTTKGRFTVYVDWNRNGVFENTERIVTDSIKARKTVHKFLSVPQTAVLGHSRMRVILEQNGTNTFPPACPTDISMGEVQDYMVNVTETPDTDIAIVRLISPDDALIDAANPTRSIQLKLGNMGSTEIDTVNIAYSFINDTSIYRSYYQWTGNLQPGRFTTVTLPSYTFVEGTTRFNAQAIAQGDMDNTNNGIEYLFHRFHVITLTYFDDFEASDMLFAPRGTNHYNQNLWQRATPNKSEFAGTVSGTQAWVTDSVSPIDVYGYGNKSYLYTPIINISQIKPDTIRFYLAADFVRGSYMYMEYKNYVGKWIKFGDQNDTLPWYTTEYGFGDSHPYTMYQFPLSRVSNDFSQEVQLRFVFLAKTTARTLDGCAIDDLEIGRAKRAVDAGVVNITLGNNQPRFGQTIGPRIFVRNFGYDTLTSFEVAYHPEGSALPKKKMWTGTLPPDGMAIVNFNTSPFIVQRTMPDTFTICAYTIIEDDIYSSNDSTCAEFGLIPLQNDAGLVSIISPGERVVTGDSLRIAVRLKNFGSTELTALPISFSFNNRVYTETINFDNLLGHPLQSLESFNYTFDTKVVAPLGNAVLNIYTDLPNDDYLYNDTLTLHISSALDLVDLEAAEVVLCEYDHNYVTVELAIDNLGSRRAENFEVSYYFDNDTSTLVTETCTNIIPALSRGYHIFNAQLPKRPAPYSVVKAFLTMPGDNNQTNDTTESFGTTYTDLKAVVVLVEENETESCRVFLQVENTGNLITSTPVNITATINGTTVTGTRNDPFYPGLTYNVEARTQIPKNGSHTYTGTGMVEIAYDADPTNDQTSYVERRNFVGLPVATSDELKLEQNFPNPFKGKTDIDFYMPEGGDVRFFVINSLGEMVYQHHESYAQGKHTITFDGKDLSAGTYFYGIETGEKRLMRKMIHRN